MKLPGLTPPPINPGDTCSYWRIPLRVDPTVVPGGVDALTKSLRALGIPAAPRYIVKPAFECEVIRDQKTFGKSRWPFSVGRPEAATYRREDFAGAYDGLANVVILPLNEGFNDGHADFIIEAFDQAMTELLGDPFVEQRKAVSA